jgi:hypothetical protein
MPFTLLHPGLFAFGIACVSIPIILHLLKRKRRPIPWGAMRFLEQAFRKRRRILTIEQLILLVLRCVLLALIAMGVGSLMLGSGLQRSIPTTMVIILDQSIGSALDEGAMTALQRNKDFALKAIDELDSGRGDQVMLIGGGAPSSGIVVPESSDLSAVRALIQRIEPTDSGFDLGAALSLAGKLNPDPDRPTRRVFVIATGARGFERSELLEGDFSLKTGIDRVIAMSPASDNIENIGIAHAGATRSLVTNSGVTLPIGVRVELIRSGMDSQRENTSTVRVFDQQGDLIGQRIVGWSGGQTSISVVVAIDPGSIKPMGARTAMISVSIDDDTNERDNSRLIPIPTRTTIRVGVVDQAFGRSSFDDAADSGIAASRWVRAALSPDERFGISIIDIDAARASAMITPNLDALVVLSPSSLDDAAWERIAQLNETGALIVITPDAQVSSLGWIDRIEKITPGLIESGSVLREHEQTMVLAPNQSLAGTNLLSGISSEFDQLSRAVSVTRSVRLNPGSNSLPIAMLDDRSVLALQSVQSDGRGVVVVFAGAFDLGWTNLPARPMFVPMMQEIIRQGVGIGSSMPTIEAGDRLPSPAWVSTNQRITTTNGASIATKLDDTAQAGVIAQLDSQGATRGFIVIHPDADSARTDSIALEEFEGVILAQVDVDKVDWIESADLGNNQAGNQARNQAGGSGTENAGKTMLDSTSPGISLALLMLAAAGVIAAIEFVLARLFTTKLFEAQSQGARS